jgi:ATP-dependent RNA helicase DDX56/DBP9
MKVIAQSIPPICQGCLMSATLTTVRCLLTLGFAASSDASNPQEVEGLKKLILHTPAVLTLEEPPAPQPTEQALSQFMLKCSENDKFLISYVLVRLRLIPGKLLFFVNDIDRGFRLKLFLERFGIKSVVLNSELPVNSRLHILQEFNQGVFDYLIATDEALEAHSGQEATETPAAEDEDREGGSDAEDEEAKEDKKGKKKKKKSSRKDALFGVARGIDFKGVAAVINFDFPLSMQSYTHRIGRTARGAANGSALSLVSPTEEARFEEVKAAPIGMRPPGSSAPALTWELAGMQIKPYEFRMNVIDGFRYRVEDMLRSVTKVSIREARAAEIKKEMVNSKKLKSHFEDNPRDLQLLRHDTAAQVIFYPTLSSLACVLTYVCSLE